MSRPTVIGYLVETDSGVAHRIEGTLWLGGPATLFKSYAAARRAVLRTRTYTRKHQFRWPWYDRPTYRKVVAA